VFRQPLDQTWDVVLQPAAANLNDTWRTAIVTAWNRSFAGRYPFSDSDSDASLPEMARFLRVDGGVIAQFVSAQLAGIVERQGDQWVVTQASGRNALRVDPDFLKALNQLTRVSNVLFPNGDANLRYELRPVPTPGVIDVRIALSGRELHYFNQREEWMPFVWPGDALENRARVKWQSEQAGSRVAFDFAGRFRLDPASRTSERDAAGRRALSAEMAARQGSGRSAVAACIGSCRKRTAAESACRRARTGRLERTHAFHGGSRPESR
jgi:type VI secretion system protein ImpL